MTNTTPESKAKAASQKNQAEIWRNPHHPRAHPPEMRSSLFSGASINCSAFPESDGGTRFFTLSFIKPSARSQPTRSFLFPAELHLVRSALSSPHAARIRSSGSDTESYVRYSRAHAAGIANAESLAEIQTRGSGSRAGIIRGSRTKFSFFPLSAAIKRRRAGSRIAKFISGGFDFPIRISSASSP